VMHASVIDTDGCPVMRTALAVFHLLLAAFHFRLARWFRGTRRSLGSR
jgi:hypothetical protein